MNNEAIMDLVRDVHSYLFDGDVAKVIELLDQNPEVKAYSSSATNSWLHEAARLGRLELADHLLMTGADINFAYGKEQWTPLYATIANDELLNRPAVISGLLARGADPNVSRELISAINPRRGNEATSLEIIKLLVEGGADVNRVYDRFGNQDDTFTALEHAEMHGRPAIAAYLRSVGAVDRPKPAPPAAPLRSKRK